MTEPRSNLPMDYDEFAPTYAWARFPVAWVIQPLGTMLRDLPAGRRVLEIGCGTGNYVRALSASHPDLCFVGLDLSRPMLLEARSYRSGAGLVRGDASRAFPFADESFGLAFMVDVVHHIADLARLFSEASRVLMSGGMLVIVTDSEETLRRRSLTRFFPEILPMELARYPTVAQMHAAAERSNLRLAGHDIVSGHIPFDEQFMAGLESKCSSAMRLITPAEHAAGIARVKEARAAGEKWFSCYDFIRYFRS